jgi:hypothetical protein
MANPTVDTFEHDIASEIRQKEASITDIASAVGDIGNKEYETPKNASALVGVVVILILCGIVGLGYVGYLYYSDGMNTTKVPTENVIPINQKNVASTQQLNFISPAINEAIGSFLTGIQKTDLGYSITITSYSPVFIYMIKNENEFGDDLGLAVGNSHTIKNTNKATSTAITGTTTLETGISTQTSTTSSSSPQEIAPPELTTTYTFTDVTISNQNMRVAKSVYGTVAYAFIGNQKLVISSSTEGILALRNNILHK